MNLLKFALVSILMASLLTGSSCKKKNLAVGDNYEGGTVFYILAEGDPGYNKRRPHGLIASNEDLVIPNRFAFTWGCEGTSITGADGRAIGTGSQNTKDIVASCSQSEIAARMCLDLNTNGYDDWFLPSLDELEKLYINMSIVGGFGTSDLRYWSSTEDNTDAAWSIDFETGYIGRAYKSNKYLIRPIRTF
jgi:hypothetical protein